MNTVAELACDNCGSTLKNGNCKRKYSPLMVNDVFSKEITLILLCESCSLVPDKKG
jgi:hypothetical protein